jgi:hypothetical protein
MFFSFVQPAHSFIINPFPNESTFGDVVGVVGIMVVIYYVAEGVKLIRQRISQEGWVKSSETNTQNANISEIIFLLPQTNLWFYPDINSAKIVEIMTTTECSVVEIENKVDGKWYKIQKK